VRSAAGPSSHSAEDGKSASSESEDEEGEDEDESGDEDREMIKKPKGEVTRQYKLADVLRKSGWSPERVEKLRVGISFHDSFRAHSPYFQLYVHNRADERLDTSKAYTFQKKELIGLVCAEVSMLLILARYSIYFGSQAQVEFTELGSYRACWPVIDILKPRLKCTSERARRNRIVQGKMKARN
jgi:hypothetical protein